jgi:hypothetical protein
MGLGRRAREKISRYMLVLSIIVGKLVVVRANLQTSDPELLQGTRLLFREMSIC